jgi:L-histidine Nalpha-methyltransferase
MPTATAAPAADAPAIVVDVHLQADDLARALLDDVRSGLGQRPRTLPPKWFYDDRGSELFDQITRLAEYYPTRCEREILVREATKIAARSGADTVVELGSGTSEKTRILLQAFDETGQLRRFVPFDVSEQTLVDASHAIAAEHPGLEVHAVVGDFEHHLPLLPTGGRRLVAFLGGTIGNMDPSQRKAFLTDLRSGLASGDSLLLGTDLVKDPGRLVPAYDDAAGVTAEFNRNVLHVINRRLGADFEPSRFAHVAVWNVPEEWIEMRLRSLVDQTVWIPALDVSIDLAAGEEIRTEISAKFRLAKVARELDAAGFELDSWWTDAAGDFALSLAFAR